MKLRLSNSKNNMIRERKKFFLIKKFFLLKKSYKLFNSFSTKAFLRQKAGSICKLSGIRRSNHKKVNLNRHFIR